MDSDEAAKKGSDLEGEFIGLVGTVSIGDVIDFFGELESRPAAFALEYVDE